MKDQVKPSGWRVLSGFLLAPALPALLASIIFSIGLPSPWIRGLMTFPFVLVLFGYVPALFVGLPTYAILRWKHYPNWLNCALAGAFTAALPWTLISLLLVSGNASVGGRPTVVNGHLTWFGFMEHLKAAGMFAAFGAIGGGVFGLIVARSPRKSSSA